MVAMAYFYLSVIRYPTELARLIWWQAQLNTDYLRVGVAWLVFTVSFLATGLWYTKVCHGSSLRKGWRDIPKESRFYFCLTVAAGAWFPFYMKGDQDVLFLMLLFLHGVAVYWIMTVTGSCSGKELF